MPHLKKNGLIGIIARLGSRRLKDKHLLEVSGKPILEILIKRINHYFTDLKKMSDLKIVILTGEYKNNNKLGSLAEKCGVSVYYGNDQNIPLRLLEACEEFNCDFLVSVDGDDILCSPEGIYDIYKELLLGSQYVKTINYPFGMNSFGFSFEYLKKILDNKQLDKLETGWGWIFEEEDCKLINNFDINDRRLRFTLDYRDDFLFFKRILEAFSNIHSLSTSEIVNFVINEKIYLENMDLNKKYWENFNKLQKDEMVDIDG